MLIGGINGSLYSTDLILLLSLHKTSARKDYRMEPIQSIADISRVLWSEFLASSHVTSSFPLEHTPSERLRVVIESNTDCYQVRSST